MIPPAVDVVPSTSQRLLDRLDRSYAIGDGVGANRIGYSAQEDEAHRLAAGWMREAGLEVSIDEHGNLIGRLLGTERGLPEVWTGSHLDSVPRGGKYDGALGVLGGIEALSQVGHCPATLAVVAFRDEERGCTGSHAFVQTGPLPGFFVELHHEQGPQLERAGVPVAVVTGIVAYARGWKTVEGRAGHAGTTPMAGRDDALLKAAAEFQRIHAVASAIDGAVATVGQVEVAPGGANVIPDRVGFSIDARAPDAERLDRLVAEIGIADPQYVAPCSFAAGACAALREAIDEAGVSRFELVSGAGHDAGILQQAGVQAGMLFVRAQSDGVSHSPRELALDDDVAIAVDVLARTLARLAGRT